MTPKRKKPKNPREQMTARQQAFIAEYVINGGNATAAAAKAGYSGPGQSSWNLLQGAKIQAEIKKLRATAAAVAVFNLASACKNAQRHMDGAEGQADYRTALVANDQLIKLTGLYAPEKHDVSAVVATVEFTPEQIKKMSAAYLAGA